VNIRYAKEIDLAAIIEIYNAAIPGRLATADLELISVESRIGWFHAHSPVKYPIWIVDCQGETAGWLSLQEFYQRPAYHKTAEISIYIAPTWQSKGLGKELLRHAIAQCPKLGIHSILGFVFGHNQPSLKLFASFGFEQWGCMPRIAELDAIERDLVVLGMRIS
jgi:L-amino acid N-acyltransferase YncA